MKNFSKLILIILLSFIFLIITYFSHNNSSNTTSEPIEPIQSNEITYIDDNPIKLGIYNSKRLLVTECVNKWIYHKDILEYNIFYTQEETIDTTRVPVCFDKYASMYEEDISMYRTGFNVKFSIGNTEINKTVLSPKDVESFFEYLEIYLYDGYHRKPGEWYSHTTEEEFNENTLFTGIKLTSGVKIKEITSDITLTVFSYDNEDDFDENGNYRGNSFYTITVKNGN